MKKPEVCVVWMIVFFFAFQEKWHSFQASIFRCKLAVSFREGNPPFHQKLNGTLPTDRDRAIRYSGFFGVRSVGPVGDFLDPLDYSLQTWTNWPEEWSIFSGANKKTLRSSFCREFTRGPWRQIIETKSTILII